jgi:hypothetical protein
VSISSPLSQAPAAVAEQFVTSVSSAAHGRFAQVQLSLSAEKQHFCAAVGGGHSATGLPSVTAASADTEPHWQYDDAGLERQVNGVQMQRDWVRQQTPRCVSLAATEVGLQVVSCPG